MKRGSRVSAIRRVIQESGGALTLVVALMLGMLGDPMSAGAQPAAKVPRIGVLFSGAPATSAHAAAAFEQGLRDLGYREGREIVIERRFGEARVERMAEIAAELVRMNAT